MTDDRANELRALEQVIERCRLKAMSFEMPAVSHILQKAGLSLSDHTVRAAAPRIPPDRARPVPRIRSLRH